MPSISYDCKYNQTFFIRLNFLCFFFLLTGGVRISFVKMTKSTHEINITSGSIFCLAKTDNINHFLKYVYQWRNLVKTGGGAIF